MQDTKLFETILGLQAPWRISRVALDTATGLLDGTPSKTGLYSFKVRAADSSSPPQNNYGNYFLEVRPGRIRNDSIATGPMS